jgi:hypothetical protein
MPGDSILVRITIENRANITSDSLEVYYSAHGVTGHQTLGTVPLVLAAGERLVRTDTFVVGGYTFGEPSDLRFDVLRYFTSTTIPHVRTGVMSFPVASSGYQLDIVVPPGPVISFAHGDHSHVGWRVRHKQPIGLGVTISNPFQLPLPPIDLTVCVIDLDHCFLQFETSGSDNLAPGSSSHASVELVMDTRGQYFDWWRQRVLFFRLCGELVFGGGACQSMPVLLVADFEAECAVLSISAGTVVEDLQPECGVHDRGSAYRFNGSAGERYRVEVVAGSGVAFLSDEFGIPEDASAPQEITITTSGVYYVIVRHAGPISFRLQRS